jgi:hypothetical protein
MLLMITDKPSTVFEKCSIYIIGPLRHSSSQHRYILTIQDDLSKFLIAVLLLDETAEAVAKTFVDTLYLHMGYKLFQRLI